MRLDEHEWIGRARQGDGAAWEALLRLHQEAVFRLAYLLLGEADQAEDIAQETFIRAYQAFHRFDPARPLRPWLLSIAANLARNQMRASNRRLAFLQRLGRAESNPAASIEGRATGNLEAETLWQAVRRLEPADQQIIYLRYFLDLPVEETAATLRIAPGTVKSRLNRAMGRLRCVIAQDFPALREGG